MKRKAFTLIELIAVLVILAILALIVTPLVMNIIKKARISADKRSIDAYGRSLELAVATFLLDNGRFPTSINDLTIEYTGDQVVCSTTQLNSDSSVYLSGCTVGGRSVDYTYGTDLTPQPPTYTAYTVGDEVTYNNVDYYVIKDSDESEDTVTLLKAEPLSYDEVQTYSAGTGANTNNNNNYGGMAYYSSSTCGSSSTAGCTSAYVDSNVKYVVDAWKNEKAPASSEARLITTEITTELGCSDNNCQSSSYSWLYNNNYSYWTMTPVDTYNVFCIGSNGGLYGCSVSDYMYGRYPNDYLTVVRPVIILSKSEL